MLEGEQPVVHPVGDLVLGQQRQRCASAGPVQQRHDVRVAGKSRAGLRDVVGHDQIEILRAQLAFGVLHHVFGLGRKADQQPIPLVPSEPGQDVRVAFQRDRERAVPLLDLLRGDLRRPVVGNRRGRHHHRRPIVMPADGLLHLHCRTHRAELHSWRRSERGRAAYERDGGSALPGHARQGEAHLAGRAVTDEADRINRLAVRSCGHDDVFARQVLVGQRHGRGLDDVRGLGQPALPLIAAGQIPVRGIDDLVPPFAQRLQIRLRRGMGVHVHVHGRGDHDRGARDQQHRGQQIVGDPMRQLGQQVGRGRRDQNQVRGIRQPDVSDFGFLSQVERVRGDRVAGQGLQGERGNELLRVPGHHHADGRLGLHQQTDDLGRFIRRDAAAHAQHDGLVSQAHALPPDRIRRAHRRVCKAG